jgi:hypothetical protein
LTFTGRKAALAGVVPVALAAIGFSAGCGSGASTAGASAEALTAGSSCESWGTAPAGLQRGFAALKATDGNIARYIERVNVACAPERRAMTIGEAMRVAFAPPPDPYAATRIKLGFRREIAESVRSSWNVCGGSDVCIPGTYAFGVNCQQPDLQVRMLSCFVTTERGGSGGDYGYTVKVTVGVDGSYSWRIDRA